MMTNQKKQTVQRWSRKQSHYKKNNAPFVVDYIQTRCATIAESHCICSDKLDCHCICGIISTEILATIDDKLSTGVIHRLQKVWETPDFRRGV